MLDFFWGVMKLSISPKNILPIRLGSTSIFLYGAIALLHISIKFWMAVWSKIADNGWLCSHLSSGLTFISLYLCFVGNRRNEISFA